MEALPTPTSRYERLRQAWGWATRTGPRWRSVPPLLLMLLAVALALRLYGVGWDRVTPLNNGFFHPDERSIYMRVDDMFRLLTKAPGYQALMQDERFRQVVPGVPSPSVFLDADKSPLNPHWFPLGTLVIYMLLIVKLALAPIVTMRLEDLALAGRTLSALADVGTIAMVYVLGRRLYGHGAGLLAAVLVTFAVTHIQHSHFYRPETFTNLFTLAAFWAMLQVWEQRRVRDSALLGLFVGLSFATKVSVLPLLSPLVVLYGYLLVQALRRSSANERADYLEKVALRALMAGVVAVAVYLFTTPYALLDFPGFLSWNLGELDVVRHAGTRPYTVQYIGAPKFLYELRQSVVWGLGLPLGLLAWGGFLATVALNIRRPRLGQALLLLWAIPLLLTVGSVEVKFLRYVFPLMPVFILMGAGIAIQAVGWLGRRSRWLGVSAAGLVGLVVAATVLYALAFETIYSRPHSAVQASRWINDNLRTDMRILTDNHWDEGIPDLGRYPVTQLPMFDSDSTRKMEQVATLLAGGDYLVFYS
ncbi:MAG: glycosyltransferase family 39 protein, partial [Chloroflexi bacterium]|nr:glycosyltransferase family 39 protein [Chloroflexota bacterium]